MKREKIDLFVATVTGSVAPPVPDAQKVPLYRWETQCATVEKVQISKTILNFLNNGGFFLTMISRKKDYLYELIVG